MSNYLEMKKKMADSSSAVAFIKISCKGLFSSFNHESYMGFPYFFHSVDVTLHFFVCYIFIKKKKSHSQSLRQPFFISTFLYTSSYWPFKFFHLEGQIYKEHCQIQFMATEFDSCVLGQRHHQRVFFFFKKGT